MTVIRPIHLLKRLSKDTWESRSFLCCFAHSVAALPLVAQRSYCLHFQTSKQNTNIWTWSYTACITYKLYYLNLTFFFLINRQKRREKNAFFPLLSVITSQHFILLTLLLYCIILLTYKLVQIIALSILSLLGQQELSSHSHCLTNFCLQQYLWSAFIYIYSCQISKAKFILLPIECKDDAKEIFPHPDRALTMSLWPHKANSIEHSQDSIMYV